MLCLHLHLVDQLALACSRSVWNTILDAKCWQNHAYLQLLCTIMMFTSTLLFRILCYIYNSLPSAMLCMLVCMAFLAMQGLIRVCGECMLTTYLLHVLHSTHLLYCSQLHGFICAYKTLDPGSMVPPAPKKLASPRQVRCSVVIVTAHVCWL